MGAVGGVEAHSPQIEVFQDVEHLDDMAAAGGGRGHGDDVAAPIGAADHRALLGRAAGQVLLHQQALVLVHLADNLVGHRPLIEPVSAVLGHRLHGVG